MKKWPLAALSLAVILASACFIVFQSWKGDETTTALPEPSISPPPGVDPARPPQLVFVNHAGEACKFLVHCVGRGYQMAFPFDLAPDQQGAPIGTGGPFTVTFVSVNVCKQQHRFELDKKVNAPTTYEVRLGQDDSVELVEVAQEVSP